MASVVERESTGRIEAFTDGVVAIVITLLILEIKVPHDLPAGHGLADALLELWPSYLAFFASFATVGIIWVNHRRFFNLIKRTDNTLLLLNLLLLLWVTIVPFATALVAEHIGLEGERIAAVIYSGLGVLITLTFSLIWFYAATKKGLIDEKADQRLLRSITRMCRVGPAFYLGAVAVALVNVTLSIVVILLLATLFSLPSRSSARELIE